MNNATLNTRFLGSHWHDNSILFAIHLEVGAANKEVALLALRGCFTVSCNDSNHLVSLSN